MFSTSHKTFGWFLVITAFLINKLSSNYHIHALFTVPNYVKSSSQLEMVFQGTVKVHSVEEFIDVQEGSIRLVVSNHDVPLDADDYTSYFRINEKGTESIRDHLLAFSHRDQLCKVVMIQNWKLTMLTDYLSMLYESSKFHVPSNEIQSISIGPTALLQFIQLNAALFILKDEVFVDDLLKEMYLFEARDYSIEGSTALIVICLVPKLTTNNEQLEMYKSSLADLKSDTFPRSAMVTELNYADNYNHLSPRELYKFNNMNLDRLKIEFDILQERVADFDTNLDFGVLDFRNPFKIPDGSGCSLVADQNSLKIGAKQFSGAYEAQDMLHERYIAYDEQTNLLRLDSADQYKLMYNSRTKRVIYAPEPNRTTCVSINLQGKDSDKSLTGVSSMKDVLGFDEETNLIYLGTAQLEDGTHCIVFEREIYQDELPLIVKLNLRLKVHSNSRSFLTFYFASDTRISNYRDKYAYRSLWLKRVELLMKISVSKYIVLCSQITFSQSSWDLESLGAGGDSSVLHPVRIFDTVECFSMAQQELIHLQMSLTQDVISDWTGTCEQLSELEETIEEGAMQVLVRQLSVSRTQINELGVVVYDGADGGCVFKLSSLLVSYLNYVHDSSFIGWIDNMNSPLFEMYVKILTHQEGMIMSECMLKVVSEYQVDSKGSMAMVYCSGAGFCGHVKTSELSLLDYTAAGGSEANGGGSNGVCEVYKLTKSLESNQMIEDKLARSNIERTLKKAYFPIQLEIHDSVGNEIRASTLRLKSTSVTTSKGGGPDSLGSLVARQFCFSSETRPVDRSMGNMNVSIVELTFDKHHSIVYCHRACQISPSCITYSYSSSQRICSLSNILLDPISQLQDLSNLREERSCQIYQLNSMYLFESVFVVSYSLLSRLATSTGTSYYLTLGDRDKCANMCRWNILHCSEFHHSVEDGVCAFEDQNQSLYKLLHLNQNLNEKYDATKRQQFFVQQIGDKLWNKTMTLYLYKTDYSHFYMMKQSARVTYSVVQPVDGQLSQISSIYDLSYGECLRECTIKQADCVMVDFCRTNLDTNCKLFRTNDKYLFKLNQITLDDLASMDLNVTTQSSTCTHHYLKSDSFALKRQLFLQLSKVKVEVKDLEDKKDNSDGRERVQEQVEIGIANHEEFNFELVMKIVSVMLGIIVGFVLLKGAGRQGNNLLSYQSSYRRHRRRFIKIVDRIRDRTTFQQPREQRSESMAELELEVVRELEK